MRQIPISRGLFVTVDDEDYGWLSEFKWSAKPCRTNDPYAVANIKGPNGWRQRSMNRLLMSPPSDCDVVFLDYNPLNCRKSNLRVVTKTESRQRHRVRRDSVSGLKGISRSATGTWTPRIIVDGEPLLLGTYSTPERAKEVYDKAVKRYYSPYAPLHNPEGVRGSVVRPVTPWDEDEVDISFLPPRPRRMKRRLANGQTTTPNRSIRETQIV